MEKFVFALDNYNAANPHLQTIPNGIHADVFERYESLVNSSPHTVSRLIEWPAHPNLFYSNENIIYVSSDNVPANTRYFYPVHLNGIDIFFESTPRGNLLGVRSPYLERPLNISEKVLKDVRKNLCKLLFAYPTEGLSNAFSRQHEFILTQSKLLKVKPESFVYLDGNNIVSSVLDRYKFKSYYHSIFEFCNQPLPTEKVEEIVKNIQNKESRPKKYICLNRRVIRQHRLILVDKLLRSNLQDNGILTIGPEEKHCNIAWDKYPLNEYDLSLVRSKMPITYDIEDLTNNNPVDINFDAQLKAYVNYVNETYFFKLNTPDYVLDHIFFSEKTFKPIICLQPFILVNYAHSLKYLRELGYKTFHPYINEDYDNEEFDLRRIEKIYREINRLNQLSDEQYKDLMLELLPILTHNEQVYRNNLSKIKGQKLLEKITADWEKETRAVVVRKEYVKNAGPKKIAMIGLGKLGKECAEVMTAKHDVTGYDIKPVSLTNGLLKIANNVNEAVAGKDIIFIAVPTPHDPLYGGETPTSHLLPKDFDYSIVKECLESVYKATTPDQLIVLISTVLPGTVRKQLIQHLPNRRFVYNPYLIAMGTVKEDMVTPEMLIIGTEDGNSNPDSEELIDFYKTFIREETRIVQGTWDEAESIKIFYNTFISAKLSLVNMIQDVAEKNGNINVDVVTNALKESTYRIMGPAYMKAGMGDGGACHPRDNIALRYMAQELNLGYDLFASIMQSREIQAKNLAERCLQHGKDVCIVGAAYKPSVPYTQGSYSYLVGYYVNQLGGWLSYYDPNTGDNTFDSNANVFLIGYWERWVENIVWPDNCVIIDPWRKFKTENPTIRVIHYGNTR